MPAASARAANPRPLVELARHVVIPDDIALTRYHELIAPELPGMGITLDQWQQDIWEIGLSLREDGTLCCDVMGVTLSIARQAGKTWGIMVGLVAICLSRPGTTVVWSSHHDRTSSETLAKIAGIVEKPAVRPKMRAQHPVVFTDDSRGVHFANGSRILFGARSSGFGRGFSEVDIQVYDECQNLRESALTDMLAAMNVSDIGLAFFMGTPPRPQETRLGVDEAFKRRRTRALDLEKPRPYKGVFVEFSADKDAPLDLESEGFWTHLASANPAYGYRVGKSAIERLVENMSPEDVYREVMGIWDETQKAHDALVPPHHWDTLASEGPPADTPPDALALDRSPNGTTSIAGAWRIEESTHVELLAVEAAVSDTASVVEWIAQRAGRKIPVLIASDSPAAALATSLTSRKVKVRLVSTADFARSCQAFVDDALEASLTHGGQEYLDDALAMGAKYPVGKAGAWVWDRRTSDDDISTLVAATLARHGAAIAAKKTKRSGESVFR